MTYTVLKKENDKPFISVSLMTDDKSEVTEYINKFDDTVKTELYVFNDIRKPKFLSCYGVYDVYINDTGELTEWSNEQLEEHKRDIAVDSVVSLRAGVDTKTVHSIKRGFEFDDNVFSLSTSAQLNWNRILVMYSFGLLNSKIELSTKNNQLYVLSSERVKDFALAYHTAIEQVLKNGRAEKMNIQQ